MNYLKKINPWIISIISVFIAFIIVGIIVINTIVDDISENNTTLPSNSQSLTLPEQTTTEPATLPYPIYKDYTEDIVCQIGLVIDLNTDEILFEKNSDMITGTASLAKIVTACVLLEEYGENIKNEIVTVDPKSLERFKGTVASVVPLTAGEKISVYELLYALMLPSACDAANAVAYHYGDGDPQLFIDKMNEFVSKIGCTNTKFKNAHGLDAQGQQTTAQDIAIICKKAMTIPMFMEIASTTEFKISTNKPDGTPRVMVSTIALMNESSPLYFQYAKGIKTGSTTSAGRCITTVAAKDNVNILCIAMKSPYNQNQNDENDILSAQTDAYNLLKWFFSCAGIE